MKGTAMLKTTIGGNGPSKPPSKTPSPSNAKKPAKKKC
jgi:hypothetical protein